MKTCAASITIKQILTHIFTYTSPFSIIVYAFLSEYLRKGIMSAMSCKGVMAHVSHKPLLAGISTRTHSL